MRIAFVLGTLCPRSALGTIPRSQAWTRCVEKNLRSAQFLHSRNPHRYRQGDAQRMEAILRRAGIHKPGRPEHKLAAWLELAERATKNPATLENIKAKFLNEHVIQPQDADAYFAFQARIARELGHGDVAPTPEIRAQMFSTLVADQQQTLKAWWDCFLSEDSSSYPTWAKIWALEEMSKLKALEAGETTFKLRTRETQGLFPELNREALAKVMDALIKHVEGTPIADVEIERLMQPPRFEVLYAHTLQKVSAQTADLSVTKGKWVKYTQGSAPQDLVRSIDCKGTGWCTAGEKTAEAQLKGGDFYVYYSNDRSGKPTQPRVAIRMEGAKISEVRGIGKEQHLDAHMAGTDILETKLKEFGPEGEKYQKRSRDMKLLTAIEKKNRLGHELTIEELRFLYEVDHPIDGFGYRKDPRIREIINTRDSHKDLSKALNIDPSKISLTREEALRGGIEFHFGDLDLSDLKTTEGLKLPRRVSGDLDLRGLTSAQGLKFPEHVGGYLDLRGLTSAQGLKLPERVGGDLDLKGLTSAQGLKFPEHVGGYLDLRGLTSAQGLKLPVHVSGHLHLDGLTSAQGLKLPEHVGGDLVLTGLTSAQGLELSKHVGGGVYLRGLKSLVGLELSGKNYRQIFISRAVYEKSYDRVTALGSDKISPY